MAERVKVWFDPEADYLVEIEGVDSGCNSIITGLLAIAFSVPLTAYRTL